jgi:phosphoribosyl 1,2-cyclic phosphodiesterase
MKEIRSRLGAIGVGLDEIDAIIVSHEHIDHLRGVGPIGRKTGMPVYMTSPTVRPAESIIGNNIDIREFEPGGGFDIGGIRIEPFSTSHDAADSVGFMLHAGGRKVGIATDLGFASHLVIERLKGADALLIESNHDPVMLKNGPYPWSVKQRVAGREGHLSNGDAARLVGTLLHPGLRHVLLGHMSQTNNLPELAYGTTKTALDKFTDGEVRLGVALQDEISEFIEI